MKLLKIASLVLLAAYCVFAHGLIVKNGKVKEEQPKPNIPSVQFVAETATIMAEIKTQTTTSVKSTEPKERPKYTAVNAVLTAYCSCKKCCGEWAVNRPEDENGEDIVLTASGQRAVQGVTIAVDTRYIPFGTQVEIDGRTYIAQDTGSAVSGYHIDVYFDTHEEALGFGRQEKTVLIAID